MLTGSSYVQVPTHGAPDRDASRGVLGMCTYRQACSACFGTGRVPDITPIVITTAVPCRNCFGTAKVRNQKGEKTVCSKCRPLLSGLFRETKITGYNVQTKCCLACGGTGRTGMGNRLVFPTFTEVRLRQA